MQTYRHTRIHTHTYICAHTQGSARHAPLLVGHSRKRFLASLVGRVPEESDVATAAAAVWLVAQGADCVRVHNVGLVRDALLVADVLHRQ